MDQNRNVVEGKPTAFQLESVASIDFIEYEAYD